MRANVSLGRWFGIPVGLHYSWFVIAWLISVSLAGEFASRNPAWAPATVWTLSLLTAALFFVCIVLHELAHAAVARLNDIPVRGITLFALGGVAQIERDATNPRVEFWMAAAGPAASFAIGFGCRLLAGVTGSAGPQVTTSGVAAVLGWLAYINVALALFNLIPGFPLDGGRILRSIVWAITSHAERAMRIASRVGQLVAVIFMAGGLFSLFTRGNFGGLWIAFIGWFLLEGAQAQYLQSQLSTLLHGVRVGDVMARDCASVDGNATLRRVVDEQLLRSAGRCFAVSQDGRTVGLIAQEDVTRVDRARWGSTTVAQAMRPLQTLHPLEPDAAAGDALELMGRENIDQLPIVSGGHLEGVVTRAYLLHLWQVRRQLTA